VYAANRRAAAPFARVLFTALGGRTRARMDAMNDGGYTRWARCEWWDAGYEDLWRAGTPPPGDDGDSAAESSELPAEDPAEPAAGPSDPPVREESRARAPQASVVYLTADSPDELTELRPDETYIIGGIVDRNRYKVCLPASCTSLHPPSPPEPLPGQGGAHRRPARAPADRDLPRRAPDAQGAHREPGVLPSPCSLAGCCLISRQVFEILLKWVETRDWEQALLAVMPQRKFYNGEPAPEADEDGDEDADADDGAENLIVVREEERNDFHDDTDAVKDTTPSAISTDPALEKPSVEVIENTTTVD
jgi:tRNA (guanine9-N1)-methyltransferase